MTTETVYKVVARTLPVGYASTLIDTPNCFRVKYAIDKVSFPSSVIPNSKLFAFRKIEDARQFALNIVSAVENGARFVFESKACNVKLLRCAAADWQREQIIKKFWRGELSSYAIRRTLPHGTVGCDSIELVKMVYHVFFSNGRLTVSLVGKKET